MADDLDQRFKYACENALKSFDLNEFKENQSLALKEIVNGKDVFVILPTGAGKSLIFQAAPLVFDYMEGKTSPRSIVLVISPLVSLMRDQVNFLMTKNIKATFLGEEQDSESIKDGVERGEFQIVYGSPETFLANKRWRAMLSGNVYRKNLRLVCVDEAHCISHWGFSSKKGERAFRIWFSRINEIRSLVKSVPLLALTATATKKTRECITKTLEMDNAVLFTTIPNRENIGYCVQLTACEARKTFKDIIEELKVNKKKCQRVIIYCPRIRVVSTLYGIFKAELGEAIYANGDISNPKQRTLEMYHARIDEQNKEEILSSFSQEDGCIRVLIATIAYGMGIDCKGVKTVIHYGPPRNLEAYLQESGRAGRSSETGCKAIILYSNVMLQHCDSDIVDYVRNDDLCRRKLLLTHFDFKLCELKQYENPHECCDICQKQCHCAGDKCDYVYFNAVGSLQQDTDASRKERSITDEQKTKLTSKLEYLKKSLNNSYTERASNTDLPLFTPVNLLSGFGDSQIVQVVDNARKLFTLKCIYRYVDIWNDDVAVEILFALSSVFADIDFNFEENETEDTDPLPDTGLWDFNDDDDDDYELLAISEFLIAEDMHGSCDYVDDSSL